MSPMRMDSLAGLGLRWGPRRRGAWERVDAKFVRGWKPVLGWKNYEVRAFVMVGWLVELMKPERIRVVALETGKDDSGKFEEI